MSVPTKRYTDGQFCNDCVTGNGHNIIRIPWAQETYENFDGDDWPDIRERFLHFAEGGSGDALYCSAPCSSKDDCDTMCGKDSAGNYYYGCFYPGGDVKRVCMSAGVKQFPGDVTDHLVNRDFPNVGNRAERGVTLYENFGLNESFKPEGLYGNSNVDIIDSKVGDVPNLGMADYFNMINANGLAVSDYGRKIILFGNVEFSTFDCGAIAIGTSGQFETGMKYCPTKKSDDNCINQPWSTDAMFPSPQPFRATENELFELEKIKSLAENRLGFNPRLPFLSGMVHRIKFDAGTINPEKSYDYFGNSAVEMHMKNNVVFRFTGKNTSFNKTSIFNYLGRFYFTKYWDAATKTLWLDASFWYFNKYIVMDPTYNIPILKIPPMRYTATVIPVSNPGLWNIDPVISEGELTYDETVTNLDKVTPGALNVSLFSSATIIFPGAHIPVAHAYDGVSSHSSNYPNPMDSYFEGQQVNTIKLRDYVTYGLSSTMGYADNHDMFPRIRPVVSGFKSMYIPPHMEIQSYVQAEWDKVDEIPPPPSSGDYQDGWALRKVYYNQNEYDSDDDGYNDMEYGHSLILKANPLRAYMPSDHWKTVLRTLDDEIGPDTGTPIVNQLPLTYKSSSDQNGAFYTLGNPVPNSGRLVMNANRDNLTSTGLSIDSSNIADVQNENNIFKERAAVPNLGKYGSAGMFNCALMGIKVAVRTDPSFYNQYLNYWGASGQNSATMFMPEICLIPNFQNGKTLIDTLQSSTGNNYTPTAFQTTRDPNDYWTKFNSCAGSPCVYSMNQESYDGEKPLPTITFNPDKTVLPQNVIPAPNGTTGTNAVESAVLVTTFPLRKQMKKIANFINKRTIAFKPVLTPMLAATNADTSKLRIWDFDIVDGVYSVEWLYVLYNCALSCQGAPSTEGGDTQSGLSYPVDSQTGEARCKECKLFNSPYYQSTGQVSDSLEFMRNYCGIRNLTEFYAGKSVNGRTVLNNECHCTVSAAFCPTLYDGCDATASSGTSGYTTYVGDNLKDNPCNTSNKVYCDARSMQAAIALAGGETRDNLQISKISACNLDINTGSGTGSDTGSGDDTESTTSIQQVIVIIIILLIIVIIMIAVGYFGYEKYKQSKNNSK